MNAIRVHELGGPEVLRMEVVPDPIPGPGQVLVRVRAAGVNPVETYIRSGAYAKKLTLPYTPGSDGAGTIEALGSGVSNTTVRPLAVGDRVYLSGTAGTRPMGIGGGTYGELAICEPSQVHRLPERMSFAQGAGVGIPYATAYHALFECAKAQPGDIVLVHGASGGVGLAAVQLARAAGMRVIGTAGTVRGRQAVLDQGAHHAVDHREASACEEIAGLSPGGVHVILEMLANVNLGTDLTLLAKHGRVVVIGSRGPVEIDPREAMARSASVIGMLLFNLTQKDLARVHAALEAGLENGTLRPVVGQEFPLAEAARAHQHLMSPGACGKIVLVP